MRSVLDGEDGEVAVLTCCTDARPLTFERQLFAGSVVVQLERLRRSLCHPITPLTWDFAACGFACLVVLIRNQAKQRRNRGAKEAWAWRRLPNRLAFRVFVRYPAGGGQGSECACLVWR
jgi:hypothetical protein